MKIVKFENGKYGVRGSWFFGWRFKDLADNYWWRQGHKWFKDCQGTEERAREVIQNYKCKYTIVE